LEAGYTFGVITPDVVESVLAPRTTAVVAPVYGTLKRLFPFNLLIACKIVSVAATVPDPELYPVIRLPVISAAVAILGTPVPVVFLSIPVVSPDNATPFILTTVSAVEPVASPVCVAFPVIAISPLPKRLVELIVLILVPETKVACFASKAVLVALAEGSVSSDALTEDKSVSTTPIDIPELSSTPASPGSGLHRFYAKTDGKPYSKSAAGIQHPLNV